MRSRFRFVLASALAIFSAACAASSGTGGAAGGPGAPAPTDLAEGERPRENNQTREAERQIGLAMLASGDAAEQACRAALAQLDQAIAADPRNPLPWRMAGEAYICLQMYAEADSVLDEAEELRPVYKVEIDPMREQAWIDVYNAGAETYNTGAIEAAVEQLEDGVTIYDGRPELRMFLGQVYMELGENDEAADHLMAALEMMQDEALLARFDSATVAGWAEQEEDLPPAIAQALMNAGRLQEAIGILKPLLEADPANAPYARSLANLYAQTGQVDSARAVFQRLENTPGAELSSFDYYVIGTGYHDMEDFERAATSFGSALRVAPNDRDAAEWRARSYFELVTGAEEAGATPDPAHVEGLVAAAEKWLELDPNSGTAHTMLAQALVKANPDNPRINEVVEQIEALPVRIENLELRRGSTGGGTIFGDLQNVSLEAGQNVTVRFTFYGEGGAQLGTQEAVVRLPPQNATGLVEVNFQSDQDIQGYTYQVMTQQ